MSCCFVCCSCGENIVKHYYNDHLKECLPKEEVERRVIILVDDGYEFNIFGFTSEESLNEFKKQLPKGALDNCKEYSIKLNPELPPKGKSVFKVEMCKDGSITYPYTGTVICNRDVGVSIHSIEAANSGKYRFQELSNNLVVEVWASNYKEAVNNTDQIRKYILNKKLWGKDGKYVKKLDK